MSSLLEEIDSFLETHHNTRSDMKAIMRSRKSALCLAEIVFNSLFFAGHQQHFPVDAYSLDCLTSKCQLLTAHDYTGFYCLGTIQAVEALTAASSDTICTDISTLADEDLATQDLADLIQADAESALVCWHLAQQIAQSNWWKKEDLTYDCMVFVGLAPMYENYDEPCEGEGETE